MKAAFFLSIARAAKLAPDGEFEVDRLDYPFGRDALASGAVAAQRAEHHHRMALGAADRNARLRRALDDAVDACRRIQDEANLSGAATYASALENSALAELDNLPPAPARRRGSPGRVVHAAAAEAVAGVWASAASRPIPRSGKVAANHPLASLMRAIAADLFDSPGALSVSLLRTPKK